MPSPILKQAAEEIKAILEKHDIAASITLQSPNAMEFVYALCPTWACTSLEKDASGRECLRIRALAKDFPSKAAQQKVVEQTAGMILGFAGQAKRDQDQFMYVAELLAAKFDISHFEKLEDGRNSA